MALFLALPSRHLCAAPVREGALSGTYGSSESSAGCSVQITGQTEERFGQAEVLVVMLTVSNSGVDVVQVALRNTGDFASRLGLGSNDHYERIDGGRIETHDGKMVVSPASGATRGESGMMEVFVGPAVVRKLVDAILKKAPFEIRVKPTWQRSELVFGGVIDLPAKDALPLAQCVTGDGRRDVH